MYELNIDWSFLSTGGHDYFSTCPVSETPWEHLEVKIWIVGIFTAFVEGMLAIAYF